MLDTILNVFLIIASVFWIVLCVIAFQAIRLWKGVQQAQRERDAVILGMVGKKKREV